MAQETVTVTGQRKSQPVANVACSVDIYPFEGGQYTIQGGQVLAATISKNLYAPMGTMSVVLAPGGPRGTEDQRTWSQIITPMSHILVGMTRGRRSAIVMDGVVTIPSEQQSWSSTNMDSTVSRGQVIQGADFGWFFKSFNFFALTFYAMTAGTPVGNALDFAPASIYNILGQGGLEFQSPIQMGQLWYNKIMAGPNAILGKTYVPYINSSQVSFYQAMSTQWENYPIASIPFSDYFMVTEESWYEKFQNIFASPWYEFFITTTPQNSYLAKANPVSADVAAIMAGITAATPPGQTALDVPFVSSGSVITDGTFFTMQSMPQAKAAGPVLVARVNPTPTLSAPLGDSGPPGSIDVTRWNNLPLYDFTKESFGFKSSQASFSCEESRNFYMLNPTAYQTLYGGSNSNNLPFPFLFIAASDAASIKRYGFRPQILTTRWFYDPTGLAAQAGETSNQTYIDMTIAAASWFHPLPLMARATVVIPLTPDILVGTRFRYVPFKNSASWDFYVESFQHNFVFGSESYTTLGLARGLPTSVYQDTNLLQAVFAGNAQRLNGVYVSGLPSGSGPSLQFTTTPEGAVAMQQSMTNFVNTPQQSGNQPPS